MPDTALASVAQRCLLCIACSIWATCNSYVGMPRLHLRCLSGCCTVSLQLVELFGCVRDDWIAADLAGWLAPNRIYDGVTAPLKAAMDSDEVYIVTTKQVTQPASFAQFLCCCQLCTTAHVKCFSCGMAMCHAAHQHAGHARAFVSSPARF